MPYTVKADSIFKKDSHILQSLRGLFAVCKERRVKARFLGCSSSPLVPFEVTMVGGLCHQFSSVAQSCPTLCNPMNRSTPGLPVHHHLQEFTQTQSIKSVMPSSHLILCRPLLLLPPIPPSIRVFSNESTLRMRWPEYWSFSFSIIPSKEHPGLIS